MFDYNKTLFQSQKLQSQKLDLFGAVANIAGKFAGSGGSAEATKAPWLQEHVADITGGLQTVNNILPALGMDEQNAEVNGAFNIANQIAGAIPGPYGQFAQLGVGGAQLLTNLGLNIFAPSKVAAKKYHANNYVMSQSKNGYGGSSLAMEDAEANSGQKFRRSQVGQVNAQIDAAGRTQNQLKYIIKGRDMANQVVAGSSDIYNNGYLNELNGGYEPMLTAKRGAKLNKKDISRVKRISSKMKTGAKLSTPETKTVTSCKKGGEFQFDISMFQHGGKEGWYEDYLRSQNPTYEKFLEGVHPDFRNSKNYDLETAFKVLPIRQLVQWQYATHHPELMNYQDQNGEFIFHLPSIYKMDDGNYMFLKLGKTVKENPELQGEFGHYNNNEEFQRYYKLEYNPEGNRYYYKRRFTKPTVEQPVSTYTAVIPDDSIPNNKQKSKSSEKVDKKEKGGKLDEKPNLIPEGALHARRHHIEDSNPELKGEITQKGIPVISEEQGGEIQQHAEIECNEIIFQKSVTEQLEKYYKEYNDSDDEKKKDEIAIKCGKLISQQIMENTDDKTGLINEVE